MCLSFRLAARLALALGGAGLFSAGALFAAGAWALPVRDLYEAEVLVLDETEQEFKRGAMLGLHEVLVRVSGRQDISEVPLVGEALLTPANYYDQYSYATRPAAVEGEAPETRLKLSFAPRALSALLRQAELPVWGANRPAVLLWVATAAAEQEPSDSLDAFQPLFAERRLLSGEGYSPLRGAFQYQSRRRGLPLLLPLLDLEDTTQISPDDVWNAYTDRVEEASRRYSPDAILTGRVWERENGSWSGSWHYQLDGQWHRVDGAAASLVELVAVPLNILADAMAVLYAVNPTTEVVQMKVDGVTGIAAYAQLSGYLESLTPVMATRLKALQGDQAEFEMQIEGQKEQLAELIRLDARMRLLAQEGPDGLRYLWVR